MSAQQRYRTLVHHIGRIYAAPEGTRTELLQTGLDQIVSVVGPTNAAAWTTVSADSDRLLKVWVAKEREHNEVASAAVAEQLADMLRELASAPGVCYEPPVSVLCDKPTPDTKPVVLAAVVEAPKLVVEDVVVPKPVAKPVVEAPKPDAKPVVEAPKSTVKPIAPATIAHVEDEDDVGYEEEEEEDGSKPPTDDEGEVLEPEGDGADDEEEEEEAGMEVEQIMIRGRAWWLEVNTQKIYAVIDGDDVGDEMGEMVNGKPRFYAK